MNPPEADSISGTRTGSSHAPTTLRPRNTRAGSSFALGEATTPLASPTKLTSPFQSPFHSRAASPIPSKHPSRSSSANPSRNAHLDGRASSSTNLLNPGGNSDLAASLSGLWGKSWTSLQGLASNVLGSDGSQELIKDKIPRRSRKPRDTSQPGQDGKWGPNGRNITQPGGGSREERQALIRAKRREELLTASNDRAGSSYKRRNSDEQESASAPPGEYDDREALVYIHSVSQQDTLPGISIKYNCQLAIIKKANRLWSNDGISARKTLVIPVDSCGIRGRRVSGPGERPTNILGEEGMNKMNNLLNGGGPTSNPKAISDSTAKPTEASPPSNGILTPASTATTDKNDWRHDHWILLENHTHPTEIVRIPRNVLGFFPRPRRKSVSFSDAESPSTSVELSRPTIRVSDESIETRTLGHKKRRSSSEHFAKHMMMGPGGVGTLHGKGTPLPGPSEDKLTKVLGKFNPRTPNRPLSPDGEDYFYDQSQPGANSLENFSGQVEAWVRKFAKNAAKAVELPTTPPAVQSRSRKGDLRKRPSLALPSGTGDLIELEDAFEIGDDEEEDERRADSSPEDSRGRKRSSNAPVTASGFSQNKSSSLTERAKASSPEQSRKGKASGSVDMSRKKGL